MKSLFAQEINTSEIGFFRIYARPLGQPQREITMFRGVPITIGTLSSSDPFTDSVGELNLTQITVFDTPGQGDLDWLVADTDIDIVWQNTQDGNYNWRWEGFIVSYSFAMGGTDSSLSIDLKGALYGLDSFRAKPTFPKRPVPYEILIERAFDQRLHPCRLNPLKVTFPSGWPTRVPELNTPTYLSFLKPWGVTTGQMWTGLTSRTTGSWDPVLTGHVQGLLGVMFDEANAQWTIQNTGYRRPELFLRVPPQESAADIIEITIGAPGVEVSGSRDFTQSANVIYAQGTDITGVQYSGMQVAPNGESTSFKPYAFSPLTYPQVANPYLSTRVMPKETQIKLQDGMDELSAFNVTRAQLQRFAEPGITGTITLRADPMDASGNPVPRMLIKAGRTFRIRNMFGVPEGILVHSAQVSCDHDSQTTTIEFDSKYRDQLTVEEVKARTRDALDPVRTLQVGKYTTTVNDLILPWSYAEGSGVIPSGGGRSAVEFFMSKIPATANFPYEEWTRQYPPKHYPNYYVKIGPVNTTNCTANWATRPDREGQGLALPIRMSQAGSIRLTQIAAYDKDGNVKPVRFHVSVYATNGVGPKDTPQFANDPETNGIKYLKPSYQVDWGVGQNHPMFENAWEIVQEDGTTPSDSEGVYLGASGNGLIVGWGNYFEPAGYSPGRFSRGADRTGMLTDQAPWTWDLTTSGNLDTQNPANNSLLEDAGMLYVNIYCDDHGGEPIYFMGRFFRQEPGT